MILKEEVINKEGLSVAEFSFLVYLINEGYKEEVIPSLVNKGLIGKSYAEGGAGYFISPRGKELLDTIAIKSNNPEDSVTDEFIEELRNIFPEGMKPGSNKYWRGNKGEIRKKLQSFPMYFGKYTHEEMLNATRRYVTSFEGDYTYMRLLPYFIWKVENQDGVQIRVSDLASTLENKEIERGYEGLC